MSAAPGRLAGVRLLATAATRGIGLAVARLALAEGARLALTGPGEASLTRAASDLEGLGRSPEVWAVLDVTDAASIDRAVARVRSRLGGIDALFVNVPGAPSGGWRDVGEEAWRRAFELYVLSVLRLVGTLRPDLERAGGRVVVVTSYAAVEPIEGLALSNVVRPAVHALVREMARDLGRCGVLVNALAPGRVETERVRQVEAAQARQKGVDEAAVRAETVASIPLGRYARPEEVAEAAVFLLSPANTYVTGQVLLVDGGLVRRG